MDFALPPELAELQAEATEVGRAAAARARTTEDSWIAAPDRELSLELGKRGWIGMTWPTEFGGGGRSALERFVVYEALIAEGAPIASSWFADRQMGPTLLQFGTDEQRARWLPGIIAARVDVVHRHVRARRRLRRGVAAHQRRARRRRVGDQRPEDLELRRRRSRLVLPHRPQRPRRPQAPGPLRVHRRHDQPGHHRAAHPRHDRRRPLRGDLLRRRAGAGRQPGGHRGRVVQAGDAPDGARAGRHRPAACRTSACTRTASSTCAPPAASTTPGSARRSPPSRRCTASAGCSCCARPSSRRRRASPPPPRPSAPSSRCGWPTSAARCSAPTPPSPTRACAAGCRATSATPPATRSWAAPPRSCATSWATGSSACRPRPPPPGRR
jgi:hypothetical protein